MTGSVGLYLGVVQFFFAATWIVYVIFLPQLVAQAGLPKQAFLWILMADQLVFVLADWASGVAADRVGRITGRVAHLVIGATLVSCAAFIAMPFVAPGGSPVALLVLIAVWAVTSSALRAPPLALVGRHVARPAQPVLLACSLLGIGVANAAQPYLGLMLRGIDPRVPFAVSSLSLALVTLGLVVAEGRLASAASAAPAVKAPAASAPSPTEPISPFLVAALFAALAFQVHVFIDSAPLYTKLAGAASLPTLMPLFWVAFNVAMFPCSLACKRWPAHRVMAVAALLCAAAALASRSAPTLQLLIGAQLVAGAAWAGVLVAAFAWSLARGGSARSGTWAGALSSVLALAALARLASVSAGWPKDPDLASALFWWPFLGWLLASGVIFVLMKPSFTAPRAAATGR